MACTTCTFEPTLWTWNTADKLTGIKDYTELLMTIAIYPNTKYQTYKDWLAGSEASQYINPSSSYKLSSADLANWNAKFKNYDNRAIEVTVQFTPIQQQGQSGGFCIYKQDWTYSTDPNNPLVDNSAGTATTTQTLGITCSVVKATTGPTVVTTWNSPDFRTFWLPISYKANLDAGTLNLYDDTDSTLQSYRTDNKSFFKGLTHWKGTMSGGGMLISDKYQLIA